MVIVVVMVIMVIMLTWLFGEFLIDLIASGIDPVGLETLPPSSSQSYQECLIALIAFGGGHLAPPRWEPRSC